MSQDGAFNNAVQDVDAVIHVASPVQFIAGPPEEIIVPAVKGTTNLLKSVSTHGSSVKRVVITSALGAVTTFLVEKCYDETDWNDGAVKECEEKGAETLPMLKYCASKVLAERAAWEYYEKQKAAGCSWDLTVIVPPWVLGPLLLPHISLENFGGSMRPWFDVLFKPGEIERQMADG